MKKILLTNGKATKWILEHAPYNGREWQVAVDEKGNAILTEDESEIELQKELASQGIKLGDFVQKAIKLIPESIRPKHCSKCEQRRLALNKVKELGVKETIRRLKEIG